MKVHPYICNKNFPHEGEEKTFNEVITYIEQCESDIEIRLIGNIELANTQLDILLIKKDCLIILDMKDYAGEIIGDENEDWYVEKGNGGKIKINGNCFLQARKQRYALANKLKNVVEKGALTKFRDNPGVFVTLKAWMYFKEGSTYDHGQIGSNALNWFKVLTKDTLCEEVIKANSSNNYLFTENDIQELLSIFHVKKKDIEKEHLKPIEEEGRGADSLYQTATLRLKHLSELNELITNPNLIETPKSKGIKGRSWKEIKETVYSAFYIDKYPFKELKEGEILVIHGDIGIGKTTYMLFFVENILKEGNKEVIFLDSTRIESSLEEIEHDIGKFIVVDAPGRGGNVKKKSEHLIDFVKRNKAKLIITMRTHEKDIFEDVVREKGYEIKTVEPKPPLDAVSYIVANYLRYFDVNTDGLDAKEAYEIIFSDDYVYYPGLKEALESIAEKSNGCPFYIYHTISELKRKGLQFDLATVKDLPEGVEELLLNTLRNDFVFKEKGREGNKSFLKLLICLSKIEKDFSIYLYESLYEELKDDFDIRDRVEAFKSFLSEGESVYELILPPYWKDAIQKTLKRDTKDKWLADEFIRAEAELEPKIIEKVLKREIEKEAINRRHFHLIADAAKLNPFLLDYAYEKYSAIESIENKEKDYVKFVLLREYLLRGYTFNTLKQFRRAIRNFDKALELNPEDAIAYRNRGVAYTSLKRYEKAIQDFNKAIKLNPGYVDAYTVRGAVYAKLGRYEEAIQDYNKAIELDPEYAIPYRSRGAFYVDLGYYEEGAHDYTTAIELDPGYVDYYIFRGDAYAKLDQYKKAIQDFDKAIELNPEYAHAYAYRGAFYVELEQYEEALQDCDKAIELDPDYFMAYIARGEAYANLEKYEEALQDYNKALEINPESVTPYLEFLFHIITKALEIKPDYAIAYRLRGYAYYKLERYEEAITDYTMAIELNPERADFYYYRGGIYVYLERYEEALQDLDKAIELKPDYDIAYRLRGTVYVELEQYEKATKDLDKAIELNPDYSKAHFYRGIAYFELGRYDEALNDFDKAIELNPEDQDAHCARSRAYAKLEERDEMHVPKSEVVEKATERDAIEPTSIQPPPSDIKILLGRDEDNKEIFWEPKKEINWSFVIVGSAGSGKTQTVKSVLSEFAKSGLPYIIFDFRNDYISEAKETEFGQILDLSTISINPLELDGNNIPKDQKYQISGIIDLVYNIGARQVRYIQNAIKDSYEDKGIKEDDEDSWNKAPPTFDDIKNNLERMSEEGDSGTRSSIEGIFARLDPIFDYRIFSAETVMPFGEIMKSQTIVNLGALPNEQLKAVVCEFFMRKLRYYLDKIGESREPRLYVIIDEAHRLKYDREASAGQLLKEARKYGVGMLLATQDPVDFTDVVYNNIGGIMSLQLTDPKYAKIIADHLGGKVKWQNVKNDLSAKFAAYVKFSQKPDAIRFDVIPHYER